MNRSPIPRSWYGCAVPALCVLLAILSPGTRAGRVEAVHRTDRWYGWDPFSAPDLTTDYHGSGDADLDGQVTATDLAQVREMLAGQRPPVHRADVDGDGRITPTDAALLERALAGEILPAWWNRLTTREARVDWVKRMLAIDDTSEMSYKWAYRQCLGFAQIVFFNFSGNSSDRFATLVPAGQSRFNLPVYLVGVGSTTFGHAINAILVGDDPLKFADWYFFEPQTDVAVQPGDWNMPFGTTATIHVPCDISTGGNNILSEPVSFAIRSTGPTVAARSPNLVLQRSPAVTAAPAATPATVWEPLVLPTGQLLALRASDNLSRNTDLHLETDVTGDFRSAQPLVRDPGGCVLLDAVPAGDGSCHLLWRSSRQSVPTLVGGRLNPRTGKMTEVEVIAENWEFPQARIAVRGSNELHVVWLENRHNILSEHLGGLYWSVRTGGAWSPPRRIVELSGQLEWLYHDEFRDLPRHFFALTSNGPEELLLVWSEGICLREMSWGQMLASITRPKVSEIRYRDAWSAKRVIDEADDASLDEGLPPSLIPIAHSTFHATTGVDLARDTAGRLHLAYWFAPLQNPYAPVNPPRPIEGRGRIRHRMLDGPDWTPPVVIDTDGRALCPRLIATSDQGIGLVWDKAIDQRSGLVWSELREGAWSAPQELPVTPGWSGWYPRGPLLPDGRVAITWSERGGQTARVGVQILSRTRTGPLTPVIRLRLDHGDGRDTLRWNAIPGRRYVAQWTASIDLPVWQSVGAPVTAMSTAGRVDLAPPGPARDPGFYRIATVE